MHVGCAPSRTRTAIELADVVRVYGPMFLQSRALRPEQRAALRDIERCRTAVLGGHLDVCTACGHEKPSYNSCRNRHCPKCQSLAQARWIEKRLERLLPVHYFHVVFTLPAELRGVVKRHRERAFDMLFASASATLLALARDPKLLGAELGVTMVLHTWTRELLFHPHVHAIVTGGGLSDDDARWVRTRKRFLFPVRVMGALFRGKMLAALERAHSRGHIDLGGVDLQTLRSKSWIVYAKRPFGGPEQVIRYLGRYTHRVGISNQRLVSMDDRGVTFRTKDGRSVTVAGPELLARFVEHVLPPRFVKIRHYGLHAAANATTRLGRARGLLPPVVLRPSAQSDHDWRDLLLRLTGTDVRVCPRCAQRAVVRTALPLARAPPVAA
jgi:Putative transposase/Transposase zinc-binding domain